MFASVQHLFPLSIERFPLKFLRFQILLLSPSSFVASIQFEVDHIWRSNRCIQKLLLTIYQYKHCAVMWRVEDSLLLHPISDSIEHYSSEAFHTVSKRRKNHIIFNRYQSVKRRIPQTWTFRCFNCSLRLFRSIVTSPKTVRNWSKNRFSLNASLDVSYEKESEEFVLIRHFRIDWEWEIITSSKR